MPAPNTTPVIAWNGHDSRQEKQVKDHLVKLQQADNKKLANEEARRLDFYFRAWGARLRAYVKSQEVLNRAEKVKQLVKPENLSQIFRENAHRTSATVLSEMMILSSSFADVFKAAERQIVKDQELSDKPVLTFSNEKTYGNALMSLGFVQTIRNNKSKQRRFIDSITSPVLLVDQMKMNKLKKHPRANDVQQLLKALQIIATAGNHDMLHHITAEVLVENIAKGFNKNKDKTNKMRRWHTHTYHFNKHQDHTLYGYEAWALNSHFQTWKELARINDPQHDKLRNAVRSYFDMLERIKDHKSADDKTLDYFSTLALFLLMRIKGFDDPVMKFALHRAEEIAPFPAEVKRELLPYRFDGLPGQFKFPLLEYYKSRGFDFECRNSPRDYRLDKATQLVLFSPDIAAVAVPYHLKMHSQKRVEKDCYHPDLMDLKMLQAFIPQADIPQAD